MIALSNLRLQSILARHGSGILVKLKTKLAVVFFFLFVGLSANLTSAAGTATAAVSLTSASVVASQSAPERQSLPSADTGHEEHGLAQEAVEITRSSAYR